jgi:hypothetical protein
LMDSGVSEKQSAFIFNVQASLDGHPTSHCDSWIDKRIHFQQLKIFLPKTGYVSAFSGSHHEV